MQHKSHFDLKWQCAQFTRYEKTSPMHAKISSPGHHKKKHTGPVSAIALETADLKETLAKTAKHIHKMQRELE